ncbi:MAG: DUF2322 family protein [Gammaproteobacteria bacterium]|nr:DUF2322 family protein [Gammaproteobacteria bacterium]
MKQFKDVLETLPAIDHIEAIELFDESDGFVDRIENKPGKAGSLRVYHAVVGEDGVLGPRQAEQALQLFCEHRADAEANPGKHPNIDRLFKLIDNEARLQLRILKKETE